MRVFFWSFLLSLASFHSPGYARGWCQYDTAVERLPVAVCQIPACRQGANCQCPGGDCDAPTITGNSAKVSFSEPVLLWSERCVLNGTRKPCYEFTIPVKFELQAQDRSGVSAIGVELAIELGARRRFVKVWGNARQAFGNQHTINTQVQFNAPYNSRLEISAVKACAKDTHGNEKCLLPR